MMKATIYAVPAGGEPGYAWKWRCEEKNLNSAKTFALYFDCLTDARDRGYSVELKRPTGPTAPAGPGYSLIDAKDGR